LDPARRTRDARKLQHVVISARAAQFTYSFPEVCRKPVPTARRLGYDRLIGPRLAPGLVVALVAALLTVRADPAFAGSRAWAFTQGTELVPDREIELESWFGSSTPRGGGDSFWSWWLGPVAGVTDHVEAALFAIMLQSPGSALSLDSLRLQLSYSPWNRGEQPIDLVLRGEVGVPAASGEATSAWFTVIVGRDLGPLALTANLGAWVAFGEEEPIAGGGTTSKVVGYIVYNLGAAFDLGHGLRAGGELNGQSPTSDEEATLYVGPSLAWGYGRFWLSGTFGFGIGDASAARRARVVIGIAF
jgi:hypothetical protein